MAVIANIVKKIDIKMQMIIEKNALFEKKDKMARRIQGFTLRKLFQSTLTNQLGGSVRAFMQVPPTVFDLTKEKDPKQTMQLNRVRCMLTRSLINRSICFASRTFMARGAGVRRQMERKAYSLVHNFVEKFATARTFLN